MSGFQTGFIALKKYIVKYRFLILFIAFGVLFLPLLKPAEGAASDMVFFLGRFHPLIVHFPVVLVLLALIFELARRTGLGAISKSVTGMVLGFSLLGSLGSLGLGFLLYYTGEYAGDTMQQHLWGGVLLTSSVATALFLFLTLQYSHSKPVNTAYLACLIAANIILIYTSHQGGSLTHGNEYLTEYMPKFNKVDAEWEPKPVEEMLVYEDLIVPFLDRKCMSCHNENKAKGGLNMTSYEFLLKGGKGDHPAVVPGSSTESDISRRVSLPSNDDDIMPPEGKIPLTQDEVNLLAWWIDHGADPGLMVTEASENQEIQPVINEYLAELEIQQRNHLLQKLNTQSLIETVANNKNHVLRIDPYDVKGITLSMAFPPAAFGDNDLINIQPIFTNITKASFIGSDITDDGFYYLGQMSSLRDLYLHQTRINGSGLIHLSRLKNLKLLDLSKTQITDGNLLHVLHMPALEDLYINETNISKEIVEALKENKPSLNVHLVRGEFF